MKSALQPAVIIATLLCLAAPAMAQGVYVAGTPTTGTAPAYTGWSNIDFVDDFGFDDADEGVAALTLPFTFTYFNKSYTKLTLAANGLIEFGTNTTCDGSIGACSSAEDIPDTSAPNAIVAFWWDDMDLNAGTAESTTTGTVGDRVFSIRFKNWGHYDFGANPASLRTVQVDLYEKTGGIRIYYGNITKTPGGSGESGAVGIENETGTVGLTGLSCTNSVNRCSDSDWPAGKYIDFTAAIDPDLVVGEVVGSTLVPTTVNGKPGFKFDVTATIRNQGKNPANGFGYDIYLSSDAVIDAGDTKIGSHPGPETLAGYSKNTWTDTGLTFEKPTGSGNFYIGVVVDPTSTAKPNGDVIEALESNNSGVSLPYVLGAELDGDISGPTASGPGDPVDLHVILRNRGTDPTGTFNYEVYLSSDGTLDANDAKMLTAQASLGGGGLFDQTVTATVPAVGDGTYYYILVIDPPSGGKPNGDVVEATETNNTAVSSSTLTTSASDLVVENIKVLSPVTPYDPTGNAYFGERIRVEFTISNKGGATARNFDLSLFLSDNAVITLHDLEITPSDPGLSKLTYNAGDSKVFDVDLTVPTTNGVATLGAGDYFFGVIVDSNARVPESNEANNIGHAQNAIHVRQPAMDLTPLRVDAPAAGAVGEAMPVYRVIRNVGNRGNLVGGTAYEYRYYLSSNDVVSTEDIPVPVLVGGVERTVGLGRLDAGANDRGTDLLKLPSDLSPGTYYVGLIVDPDGRIGELDEANNATASLGTVEIVPSSLRVETASLPDATVGLPYVQQLAAEGGEGGYAWSLEPSQGDLPKGLTLSADGRLAGIPVPCAGDLNCSVPGDAVFTVRVTSGNRTARARLVLRSLMPTGGLELVTQHLPTALKGLPYDGFAVAVGGVPPYHFDVDNTQVPEGLAMDGAGHFTGRATKSYTDPLNLHLTVTDAHGTVAEGDVSLRVVEPGTLVISTARLADGQVSLPYSQQLQALGASGQVTFSLGGGALPEGFKLAGGAITGVTTRAGLYPVTIAARDAAGNLDEADYLLVVLPRPASFQPPAPPDAHAGESYNYDLSAGAAPGTVFALESGALPPGLSLDKHGAVSGTVATDAAAMSYDFIVSASETTGARALAPLSIRVVPPEDAPAARAAGCSSASGNTLPLFALLMLLVPFSRRRSQARSK